MILLLISLVLAKDPIKVAVIDTGFSKKYEKQIKHCNPTYNKSFINSSTDDEHGHGTNVTGLIKQYAENSNYCFLIYKALPGNSFITAVAVTQAMIDGAQIINYSGGSLYYSPVEAEAVKQFMKKGGIFIAAAGNNTQLLDFKRGCNYYPACTHPDVHVIGNKATTSNYGPAVDNILDGNDKTAFGLTMSGSSQSTAIFTGKFIKYWDSKRGK